MAAGFGGLLNVVVILGLYHLAEYPTLESATRTFLLAGTGFTLGFVSVLVTAHTRLVTPAFGYVSVLAATVTLELTSPRPAWSELNGHVIVEGPTHVSSYANTWYVWAALFLYAGAAEFAIRRRYAIRNGRLQNLPGLPFSGYTLAWTVVGFAGFLGVATMLLVHRSGIRPESLALVVLVFASSVAVVPLAALLSRGVLLPTLLFVVVPYSLAVEVFVTTDSPVHILLFGPYAIVLLVAWAIERAIRSWVG